MCYQQVKSWVLWFAPTRRQIAIVAALLFIAMVLDGANRRRRRDEVLRIMTAQVEASESRLTMEIGAASIVHGNLQAQIDLLTWQVNDLEQRLNQRGEK